MKRAADLFAKLRVPLGEASALARQAWLLPRDVHSPVVPRGVEEGDHVVVFVHGLFATAGVLQPMRRAIGRHPGVHTAALTYPPGPGPRTVAARLAALCAELPSHASLHLVGHSLGGVVARWFAVTSNDPRIDSTVALATPFAGVRGIAWLGVDCARDLDAGSELLRELRLGRHRRHIPHLSIIAGEDRLCRGPVSHALPGGDVHVLEGRGHNALLFDPEAIRLVENHIVARKTARAEI